MQNLKLLLQREPAALGSLAASIFPVLVLLRAIEIDEAGVAAVVVAINTIAGFAVRLLATPATPSARVPSSSPAPSHAPEGVVA